MDHWIAGGRMPDKKHYDALLAKARALQAKGNYEEAHALLDSLDDVADSHFMGEQTALGLPRKLHSAKLRLAKAQGDDLRRIGYQYTLVPPPEMLARYGHFTITERRELAEANRKDVPRIIHQIWIGPSEPPASTSAWASHAGRHGYDYRLWREADLEKQGVLSNPVFADMLAQGDYPGAVDVARYIILESVGGIYLDCDWYPARDDISFQDLLPLRGLTAFAEDVPRLTGKGSVLLANSFIAAPVGHPVFRRMLDAFPGILRDMPAAPAWWATGPLIFTIVGRAGAVSLADANFVAGALADKAPYEDVQRLRTSLDADHPGLLIAWKSW
jgi:mannosyltransferase OCH1-like enzyme